MDAKTKAAVAVGLMKLADALHDLREAQAAIEKMHRTARPGADVDGLALGLTRVVGHVGEAAADVTPEMWAIMLSCENVGIEEVRKALEAAA